MLGSRPRVGVPAGAPDLAESLNASGAEPVPFDLPAGRPRGGVALAREWIADAAQISLSRYHLDGLLLAAEEPEELAGLAIAALRLNLPTVAAPRGDAHLSAAFAALGLVPLAGEPASVAVELARGRGPRSRDLIETFSLVNALRAGLSLGLGPSSSSTSLP